MKQKRTFIAVLLVIAVLALGVAFANIQGENLVVSGTASASVNDENYKVVFTAAQESKAEGDYKDVNGEDDIAPTVACNATGTTASFTLSNFSAKGDKATIKYTIENQSKDLIALLEEPVVTGADGEDDKFTVTASLDKTELAVNGTATLTVVFELDETVQTAINDADIKVTVENSAK